MKLKRTHSYALHALTYMVRHMTQLPLTVHTISKSERIPYKQLAGLFHLFSEAGIVKSAGSEHAGYVFGRLPSEVTLPELFELVEGQPLFQECLLKHCDCPGTPENCEIYACWKQATDSFLKKLSEITIETAAWGHPEHHLRDYHLYPEKEKRT